MNFFTEIDCLFCEYSIYRRNLETIDLNENFYRKINKLSQYHYTLTRIYIGTINDFTYGKPNSKAQVPQRPVTWAGSTWL